MTDIFSFLALKFYASVARGNSLEYVLIPGFHIWQFFNVLGGVANLTF
jgi:hypothetical protein